VPDIAEKLAVLGDSSRTDKHPIVTPEEAVTEPRPISPKAMQAKEMRIDAAKRAKARQDERKQPAKQRKKQAEIVDEPAKIPGTRPQSPPPMPAPSQLPPVSPYAATVPQEAYKDEAYSANAGVTEEAPQATNRGALVLAIVVVLLVIAAVVILALR
jgi:hypothetical protein